MSDRATVELSVIICSRNRRDCLLVTIDSLANQSWREDAAGPWELLVVDNDSTDGTQEAVSERIDGFQVDLRVIHELQWGLSHARNLGLEQARGRAVIFIDDDVTCLPGWLDAHGAAFSQTGVVGTGGPIRPLMPEGTPAWFLEVMPDEVGGPTSRYEFGEEEADIVAKGPIPLPFGANMGVVREVALEVGGFRSDLGWGKRMIPSEELDFFRRVQAHGGRILYVAEAVLRHRIEARRTTLDYYLKWQKGYGRSTVIMDPPSGVIGYLGALSRSGRGVIRWSKRARTAENKRQEMNAVRECERSKGRLLQLLRL